MLPRLRRVAPKTASGLDSNIKLHAAVSVYAGGSLRRSSGCAWSAGALRRDAQTDQSPVPARRVPRHSLACGHHLRDAVVR